jgi:hypothetical protein
MTDIVERLRSHEIGPGGCWPQDMPCRSVRMEAAAEIEQLRAILKECADGYEETQYYDEDILSRARKILSVSV